MIHKLTKLKSKISILVWLYVHIYILWSMGSNAIRANNIS